MDAHKQTARLPLTLGPMGRQGGGGTFCLIISLILELSAYSKRVS